MKKRTKKRFLAFLCVVSVAFGMQSVVPAMAEQGIPAPWAETTWDEDLKMLTFSKFRVADGAYSVDTKTGLGFQGEYKDSLDGTIFSGNIWFDDQPEAMLIYGSPHGDGWTGIGIESAGGGKLILRDRFTNRVIEALDKDIAGVEQLTEAFFNLKISVQFIDMEVDDDEEVDDVKLGLWFNDKLYNNQYFELENMAPRLGSVISCYVSNQDCFIQVESVDLNEKIEAINPAWEEITLKNFGISNGKYQFTEEGALKVGFEANGSYAFDLDGTIFSANVEFSSNRGVSLCYGGGPSVWHGLRFDVLGERLRLVDAAFNPEYGNEIYYFESSLAGVKLLDNKFNLKLSTEYVDSDGDGAKDDVKFGVWFNDVLYNNEYIYFPNYALEMGSNFTIMGDQEAQTSYLYIESDANVVTRVDFSLYGFSKNWNKELGPEI